ncbi:MAG: hypothetical protein HY319_23540 [Armatimonadetes bacterium]|nr:hypothetical protein [Armatimonadota bacterium]
MDESLFILSREPGKDELRVIAAEPSAAVLLLGTGVLTSPELLGDRPLYALREEVEELGIDTCVPERVERKSSREIIALIMERRVLNVD